MANRSYLFAVDHIPARYDDRPQRIIGLSEWPYSIPLAYMLLVSERTRVCPSLSFHRDDPAEQASDPPMALVGEADGGHARLMRFLDLLAGTQAGAADTAFLAAREEAKAFLAPRRLAYYFLETVELDSMSAEPLQRGIQENLANVRRYTALIDSLTPQTIEHAMAPGGDLAGVLTELGKFEERKLPTLGIGFWSEILYLEPRAKAAFVDRDAAKAGAAPAPAAIPTKVPATTAVLDRLKQRLGISKGNKSDQVAPALPTTLDAEDQSSLRGLIHQQVWGGFETKSDIEERALDHLGERTWTADDRTFLQELIERAWQEKKAAEASWPEETQFDRLDHVFFRLDTSGEFIAYPYAGYTQSDGWEDCNQEWDERGGKDSGIQGAIFYHGQDVERVIEDGTLLLTFGPMPGSKLTAMDVARRAVDAFAAAGFAVTMPPDDSRHIEITGLDWKKRSPDD